jgi:hypothetical protein
LDAICEQHVRSIVELGLGDGQRALQMIEAARKASPESEIRYVGLDFFEACVEPNQPGLSLKAAYQLLRASGAKVQLIPGDPTEGLIRMANALGKVDLLVLPEDLFSSTFARFWYFVPRILHDGTSIFADGVTAEGERSLQRKSHQEIVDLAGSQRRRAA